MLSALLMIGSIFQAFTGSHDNLAWWGAAFANLPLPGIIAIAMFSGRARTSENLPLFLLVSAFGALVAGWEVFIEGITGWLPFAVATAGIVLLLLYVFWYSRFGRIPGEGLSVGNTLPPFTLKNAEGQAFESSDLSGNPAVLVFFRGNWCPYCMAQVQEIVDRYQDLHALGVKVAMISPQSDAETQRLAKKFDVPVEFLVDEGNKLAQELGIALNNGVPVGVPGDFDPQTVMPTVVAVNAAGTIIFSDQTDNYRVRPEPDVFLAILRRSGSVVE
jgi:peroxiredoxin